MVNALLACSSNSNCHDAVYNALVDEGPELHREYMSPVSKGALVCVIDAQLLVVVIIMLPAIGLGAGQLLLACNDVS
jgi:hypothetical protein